MIKQHIIESILNRILTEQDDTGFINDPDLAADTSSNTENNDESTDDDNYSMFTEPEQKFLGTFDKTQSKHVGVIYSISDIGIREFITRSGMSYNCTPSVLLQLIRDKIIKIVPTTGWGRDDNYTIELQIPLEDVAGFKDIAAQTDDAAAGGGDMGGGDMGGGDMGGGDMGGAPPPDTGGEEPPPENAGVVKYGDLLKESINIARQLILEEKSKIKKKSSKTQDIKIYTKQSRILDRVPKDFIYHLKRVIKMLQRKTYNKLDQERLIADILDNLKLNFDLTDTQIKRAFDFHRNQKRLQKFLDKE